ncbi:MAG: lysylphosphatidylglycerol synthase transmembrane domain-containing protein [Thermoanaerobaculia bacterium]
MNSAAPPGAARNGPGEAPTPPERGGIGRALRSRAAQAAFSLALAAGLSFFFLRQVELRPLAEAIRSASGAWLAASLGIALATFVMRAIRWIWLLKPVGRVPLLPAFLATAVGFAGNNLPAKVGEVIRPALLSRMQGLPFSALLASVLFERALDGGSVVFFFLIAVALGLPGATAGPGAFAMLRTAALLGVGVFLALIGAAVLLLAKRDAAVRLFDRIARRLPAPWRPRAMAAFAAFPQGFASLSDRRLIFSVVAGSLAMWLVINVQVYVVMRAFHIELPFSAAFVVTSAAVLGLAVPTPGGIGSYQTAVQYALTRFYGVPLAPASGVAVLAWAVSFVPITLIGLAALTTRTVREPGDGRRETGDGRR